VDAYLYFVYFKKIIFEKIIRSYFMQIIQQLDSIIEEHHLLKHMYYQAWSKGELSLDSLQRYSSQYYHQVKSFPLFISRIHSRCPHLKPRLRLLENVIEEDGLHGTDHPTLWMQFAEGLGLTKEAVLNDAALPETKTMVDKFYELADRDWRDGLCALYAYESQVPEVSASKIDGLKKFYGITDENTLEFFSAHQVYDVEHAKQIAGLIEEYVEPEAAMKATREAALSLSHFLDGMCRVSHIEC
jgi:pyrroloquinoline-quinone synthase